MFRGIEKLLQRWNDDKVGQLGMIRRRLQERSLRVDPGWGGSFVLIDEIERLDAELAKLR
jgi:hypothetical protein